MDHTNFYERKHSKKYYFRKDNFLHTVTTSILACLSVTVTAGLLFTLIWVSLHPPSTFEDKSVADTKISIMGP